MSGAAVPAPALHGDCLSRRWRKRRRPLSDFAGFDERSLKLKLQLLLSIRICGAHRVAAPPEDTPTCRGGGRSGGSPGSTANDSSCAWTVSSGADSTVSSTGWSPGTRRRAGSRRVRPPVLGRQQHDGDDDDRQRHRGLASLPWRCDGRVGADQAPQHSGARWCRSSSPTARKARRHTEPAGGKLLAMNLARNAAHRRCTLAGATAGDRCGGPS